MLKELAKESIQYLSMLSASLPAQKSKQTFLTNNQLNLFSPSILKYNHHKDGYQNFTICKPHAHKTLENHYIINKDKYRSRKSAENQKTKQTCEHLAQDIWPREEDGVPVLILPGRAFCCGFSCRKNFTCTHWYVNDVHVKFWVEKIWRLAAGRIRSGRSSRCQRFFNRFRY